MNYKNCRYYINGNCSALHTECDKPTSCAVYQSKPIIENGWSKEALKKSNDFKKKMEEVDSNTRQKKALVIIFAVLVFISLSIAQIIMTYSSEIGRAHV